MRTVLARLACGLSVALFLALSSVPAFAHAQLWQSDPAQNALLAEGQGEIALGFNEPVSVLAMRLVAPDASATDLTGAAIGGDTVRITLPDDLDDGTYALAYRVISVDGHPVAGTLVFSVGQITSETGPDANLSDPLTLFFVWLLRFLLFAGLFFGAGGAVFGVFVPLPIQSRLFVSGASLVGAVGAIGSLGFLGLDALGLPVNQLFTALPWQTAFGTSFGMMAVLAVLAVMIAITAMGLPELRVIGLLAWGVGAAAPAVSGHAGSVDPQWFMRAVVGVHIAGVMFWAGALEPLWRLLRTPGDAAAKALSRFSRVAPWFIAPLILSGIILACIQLGWPSADWISAYGAILVLKLLLLAVLFALAVWNRFTLTRPALDGDEHANRQMRRSVRAEMVLILVIFALVAGWRFTPPPRAQAIDATAQPVVATMADDAVQAELSLAPGEVGVNAIEIALFDQAGEPLEALAITLEISEPELGIENISAEATQRDNVWKVEELTIPVAGNWQVELTIRLTRFSQTRLKGDFTLPQ